MGIFDGWIKREVRRIVEREGVDWLVDEHELHLRDEYRRVCGGEPDEDEMRLLKLGAAGLVKGIL